MADGDGAPEQRLNLPYRVSKTQQEKGRIGERKMARDRGAREHPASGAGRIKDDASTDETQYEFKNVAKTHSLKGKDLLALFRRAVRQGKTAEYVIYFQEDNITATITLTRGNTHG